MSRLTLGKVAGVFGIKGWLKLHSYTEPAGNLLNYSRWQIVGSESFEAKVLAGQEHTNGLIAQISDANGEPITDRDVAFRLIGSEIQIERSELPKLGKHQYYWVDLVGLKVVNTEGVVLGTVSEVTDNGAQAVLAVQEQIEGGVNQRLIPFVSGPIVQSVDLKGGVIVVEWAADW